MHKTMIFEIAKRNNTAPWRYLLVFFLAVAVTMIAGCRTAPIKEVSRSPVPASGASETQVRNAIITAGAGLGWVMKKKAPGLLVATLHLRSHMAEVEIPYSATSYSIRYKNSSNLDYDASKRTIHSNYNGWITNLNRAINASLSTL